MNFGNKTPVYSSVEHGAKVTSNTKSSRPKSRKRLHDYRPIPLRFPFLLSFVALSAVYIILIEVLLHHAKKLPVNSALDTDSSKRLFARQASALSTLTITATSTATVGGSTVTLVVGTDYTTIHSTANSGTVAITTTLSPNPTSKTSVISTSSRPTITTTAASNGATITSGSTSYFVTTTTLVATITKPAVTITVKDLQTVLIFDKPTSSARPSGSNPPASSSNLSPSVPPSTASPLNQVSSYVSAVPSTSIPPPASTPASSKSPETSIASIRPSSTQSIIASTAVLPSSKGLEFSTPTTQSSYSVMISSSNVNSPTTASPSPTQSIFTTSARLPSSKGLEFSTPTTQSSYSVMISSSNIIPPTTVSPSSTQSIAISSAPHLPSSLGLISSIPTTRQSSMEVLSSLNSISATSVLPSSSALTPTSSLMGGSTSKTHTSSMNLGTAIASNSVLAFTSLLGAASASSLGRPSASAISSASGTMVASAASTFRPVSQISDSSVLALTNPSALSNTQTASGSQTSYSVLQSASVSSTASFTIPKISSAFTISGPSSMISSVSASGSSSGLSTATGTIAQTPLSSISASNTLKGVLSTANSTSGSSTSSTPTSSMSTTVSSTKSSSASTSGKSSLTSSDTTSTSAAPSQSAFVLASHERLVQGDFKMGYYVSSLYIPAVLAILIKALWEIVYTSTRLIQPFERMATKKGASGRYSLFAQYLSSALSWDVFRAISHGNPIPLLAELSYILVQIGTPIATISTTIRPRSSCGGIPCDPVWIIDVPLLRAIEGILVVCLLCVVAILIVRARHHSGVDTDPSSLGSIATITNEENLITKMQACAIDNEPTLFEQLLRQRHFRLTDYSDSRGMPRYGIVSQKGPNAVPTNPNSMQAHPGYHTITDSGAPLPDDQMLTSAPRAPVLSPAREAFLLDLFGLLAPLILLAIILAFWLDGNLDDEWNRFFLTDHVWPKLLLVGLATVSSILMTNIERIVRTTEPFRRLNASIQTERSAPPATTLLISRSGTAYSTLMQCIMLLVRYEHKGGRMMFQTLVAFTVIVSDLNIVAVAGVAWTPATTQASFQLSMVISLSFTAFVIFVWLILIFWWRRHHAVQALRASSGGGTVAGTMRYMSCGSVRVVAELAKIYEEWQYLGSRSRMGGQWYSYRAVFGQYPCSDDKVRWCVALQKLVDFDEIQDAEEDGSRVKYY